VQQNRICCLDYADGIVEKTLSDMILEYNEEVNTESHFSIFRVVDRLLEIEEERERYRSKNSGLLGVLGNIGYSTAFHGFHLSAVAKKDTGVSLGDDAGAGMNEDPRHRLVPHIKLIGDLADEKVDILPPLEYDFQEQMTKFVKRRFTRSSDGITIGILHAFPNTASVFGVRDSYHTILPETDEDRLYKFVGQVGAFLWDIFATESLENEEIIVITEMLTRCYKKLGLNTRGSLPGKPHRLFKHGLKIAVPPLGYDYSAYDWAEYLWDYALETHALIPSAVGPTSPPDYLEGHMFDCTDSPFLQVLVDVGCVEKIEPIEEWVEVCETNRRLFRKYLQGHKSAFRCRYLSFCPDWFDDLFTSKYYSPIHDMV